MQVIDLGTMAYNEAWALQQRIHPAASRVTRLAGETPASFVAFDLLALGDDDLTNEPFAQRRAALERALAEAAPPVHVTPITTDEQVARVKPPGQIGEAGVLDDIPFQVGHEEAHAIARQASRFRRLRGLELRGQSELHGYAG